MSNVRLTIRQPPHRDYVSNYPGLTGLRPPSSSNEGQEAVRQEDTNNGTTSMDAALIGAVEVRTNNNSPVQAQYLRIELKSVRFAHMIASSHPSDLGNYAFAERQRLCSLAKVCGDTLR
jgi:hypothetical protein